MELKFEEINVKGYEKVLKISDIKSGLVGIISIHSTKLGPAVGGIRIQSYKNFNDALTDVLRLSKGMTYKSAIVQAGLGGGKSVIIADAKAEKSPEKLKAFGEAIDRLQGMYIGAEDMGCTTDDVGVIRGVTKYVLGLKHEKSSGNPSPFTAWGTFVGIKAVCRTLYGTDSVKGKTIAIQGLGSVGQALADHLFWHGAKLIVADMDSVKTKAFAKKYGAKAMTPKAIMSAECDILVPCAIGGIVNSDTIPKMNCRAVAGCANNQLLEEFHGLQLKNRGILYAPDFVINSGGLINVLCELNKKGYSPRDSLQKIDDIYHQLISIFDISEKNHISTNQAAMQLAEYRLKYGIGKRKGKIHINHA